MNNNTPATQFVPTASYPIPARQAQVFQECHKFYRKRYEHELIPQYNLFGGIVCLSNMMSDNIWRQEEISETYQGTRYTGPALIRLTITFNDRINVRFKPELCCDT